MNQLIQIGTGTNSTAMANLIRSAQEARGTLAPSTERAIRADALVFSEWCAEAGRDVLPASGETVAAFIDAMGEKKAPATVRRYLASIAYLHRAAEQENPAASSAVKNALKRLAKAKGIEQDQAAPLIRKKVDAMLAATSGTTRGLRNRALLAMAYDTLCRRSELVALRREDLETGSAGDGTIKVRRGKTDQAGAGMIRYLAADTMRALEDWLTVAKTQEGTLFRAVGKTGAIGGPLDPGDVARIFKTMARAAGLPTEEVARISGHSSRVGAAQDMVASERIELPSIMQSGGWKSPEMVSRYTRRLDAKRSGSAKLAVLQNRS